MLFKIGDLVTRDSYKNDLIFKIIEINDTTVYLKGIDIRLYADSDIKDLRLINEGDLKEDDGELIDIVNNNSRLDRNEFFYLPGKVLHIDGDSDYLKRCMKFYKKLRVKAYGLNIKEDEIASEIGQYLNDLNPDIVVITGHDVYYKRIGKRDDLRSYKNSSNFVASIKAAREYEKSHDKLVIIAGACQSDYEELIKAGANFASSPKRINLHALDPAIISTSIALSDRNKPIDLVNIIGRTKYKEEGIGGIITNGTMYVGYPRWI